MHSLLSNWLCNSKELNICMYIHYTIYMFVCMYIAQSKSNRDYTLFPNPAMCIRVYMNTCKYKTALK